MSPASVSASASASALTLIKSPSPSPSFSFTSLRVSICFLIWFLIYSFAHFIWIRLLLLFCFFTTWFWWQTKHKESKHSAALGFLSWLSRAFCHVSPLASLFCLCVVVICCFCCCCRRPRSKFKNLYLLLLFLVKKLLSLNVSRCDYLGIENRHKSSLRHFDKENQLIHCNRNGIFASLIYRAKAWICRESEL